MATRGVMTYLSHSRADWAEGSSEPERFNRRSRQNRRFRSGSATSRQQRRLAGNSSRRCLHLPQRQDHPHAAFADGQQALAWAGARDLSPPSTHPVGRRKYGVWKQIRNLPDAGSVRHLLLFGFIGQQVKISGVSNFHSSDRVRPIFYSLLTVHYLSIRFPRFLLVRSAAHFLETLIQRCPGKKVRIQIRLVGACIVEGLKDFAVVASTRHL